MEQRVTLSDFHALQATLLETRKALYESREREKKALDKVTALRATFPPPPPRRQSGGKAAAGQPNEGSYPDELNPFGGTNPFGNGAASSASPTRDAAELTAASRPPLPADAREAALRERCVGARRARAAECRALLRLIFHAWRASHSLTCILRNMMQQARAGGGAATASSPQPVEPVLPLALRRLSEGNNEALRTGLSTPQRDVAEAGVLGAELGAAEAAAEDSYQRGAAHGYQLGAEHGYRLGIEGAGPIVLHESGMDDTY